MVTYNGWAIIRDTYTDDFNFDKEASIVNLINNKLSTFHYDNEFYDLRNINGNHHLTIQAGHNHRHNEIIEFFKWIAEIAPGSFGLLYIHDDEDLLRQNENRFKVWRMRRGTVDELDDTFLSPLNPAVED